MTVLSSALTLNHRVVDGILASKSPDGLTEILEGQKIKQS